MRSDADSATKLPPQARRRQGARIVLRAIVISIAIVVAYFALPMTSKVNAVVLAELLAGLIGFAALLTWQIRGIARSPYPLARAISTLAISVPLFLAIFATVYYLMGQAAPNHWSEPLSRLDSAYFTVTIFATVGFGDITAVSEVARAVTTVQMIGNIILVGVIARVIVGVVQEGLRRQGDRTAG